jgi:SacI homology domain
MRGDTDERINGRPRCMVEFAKSSPEILRHYRPFSPLPVRGALGLITINGDVFLSVVTGAVNVATLRPGETVEKIFSVEFYCLNTAEYDDVFTTDPLNAVEDNYGQSLSYREPVEHPCTELQKLLSDGSFYFSTNMDLTNRLQNRQAFQFE